MKKFLTILCLISVGVSIRETYNLFSNAPKPILYQIEIIRGDNIEVFCSTDAYCYDGTCYWFINEMKQTGVDSITVFNLHPDSDCMAGVYDLKDFYKEGRGERYHYQGK